jgi:phospholipid/cholesterol/gamma-HCH transport system permease protein
MGSYINVHFVESSSLITFYQNAFSTITFIDVIESIVKSVAYGFTIGFVGCYNGYNASQGTRGVGRAANQAVVFAMFFIFIEEILIVQIFTWIINS